jgi:hypothetical protein
MASEPYVRSMLLDDLMPAFDATRIEHRVIPAPPGIVFDAAIHADLVDAVRHSRMVRGLFALRGTADRVAATARHIEVSRPSELPSMRLADLPEHGDWVRLGEDPPNEFAFGVVGRFWAAETSWAEIDSDAFAAFDRPGYAKIAANLSLRAYGDQDTLVTYEARTKATDEAARRAFLRYWTFVSPGVGVVMRSALKVIADEARRLGAPV